jgi:hypothetical protein
VKDECQAREALDVLQKLPSPRRPQIVSIALFAIFAASAIRWVTLNRAPPNWDDAWYLANSLRVYDALTQHGVLGFLW